MEKFKVLNRKIGPFRCVSLTNSDGLAENCLAGELGEIWIDNEAKGTCKAFKVVNRRYEKIISFNIKDLYKWVTSLKVPADPKNQLVWANNPNSRLG